MSLGFNPKRIGRSGNAGIGSFRLLKISAVLTSLFGVMLSAVVLAQPATPGQTPREAGAEKKPEWVEGPLSPDKALAAFVTQPGLKVELVASEPLIESPVALAFDERGRLFVAENRGYPTGPGEGRPPIGRIALLHDDDGDGAMDRRSTFAENLTYPNGLLPWEGGLIVTCAPEILFLRDTDGDGKADERKVLFNGFDTTGSTQLRVSHPTLSLDNWVYVTSGLKGGKVVSPAAKDQTPVVLARTDFRFRPDGTQGEAADGGAQFGITFDDFNRRFICYNRVQVQHVVLSSKTLRRNPNLPFSETVQNCPAETVAEPLKGHGAAAKLFPLSRNVTTADSHAGTFTAACAVTVFKGLGLPAEYRGRVFSCDPTGNLVHVDRLQQQGATFAAYPVIPQADFLASRDNWCRPVFLSNGPDGALYVCDMYRKTIEHPDYLPVEIRKRTNFEGGKGMGRIWRVVRSDLKPSDLKPLRQVKLDGKSTAELCEALKNPEPWVRDTVHRLLLQRRDDASVEPLKAIVKNAGTEPATLLIAAYLLESLGKLDDATLKPLLKHSSAPVRENAVQLVETRLASHHEWLTDLLALANDPDSRVRFVTAAALGALPKQETTEAQANRIAQALARIATQAGADRWLNAVVFSSLLGREALFLQALSEHPQGANSPDPVFLKDFGRLLGTSEPQDKWPSFVASILSPDARFSPEEQAALITGLCEAGRGKKGVKPGQNLLDFLVSNSDQSKELKQKVGKLVETMKAVALDHAREANDRLAALGLLTFADFDQVGEALVSLLNGQDANQVQAAAARSLGLHRDERVVDLLLDKDRFASFTPRIRDEVLSALTSQANHVPGVLTAIEQKRISPSVIDALRRRQLMQSRNQEVRKRATQIFGAVAGDRAKVYDEFKSVVNLKPSPKNGQAVFKRECAQCHRLDQEGSAVGPDLFGIRNQPKEAVLLHILVPDHEITQGYAAYTVATNDGRVLTGLIASETPTSLTLRQPLGKEDTILRTEVEELSASQQSLMPQGLEKNISKQEFADLLAYLKGEGEVDHPKETPAQ